MNPASLPPAQPARIEVRPLAARDSIEGLTALLHRAYSPLLQAGMNFSAATQTPEHTRSRIAQGHCLVADFQGELAGTIIVCGPYDMEAALWSAEAPWYNDPHTAHLHQFAVDPRWQHLGIGRRLVAAGEAWARDRGYRWMTLETADTATGLRRMYRDLGYSEAGQVQWPGRTYVSVVMRKSLDRSPLAEHLQLMAHYNLWATRRLLAQVDTLPDADYRRNMDLAFGSVHGTLNHLLVGEHLLWFRRFAEGHSDVLSLDTEVEPDRARLRQRLLDGALAWLPLLAVWPEERLHGTLAYRRIHGQPMVLPFAATLLHVFNHGTHHRGQISAALTALGQPAPMLDLVVMLQEEDSTR
jgi:uncharacterized damage-inducible protein DinB/ribosomal protein S18 acetylase RimI-like enzyme